KTKDYYMTVPLVAIANETGKYGLIRLARDWSYEGLLSSLNSYLNLDIAKTINDRLHSIFVRQRTAFPTFTYLPDLNQPELNSLKDNNEKIRRELRGEAIAGVR
ncbi:MAG: hypothetical protein U9P44_03590, partial [archaeon]|nr:hypothetical protein [archaeon]